LSELQPEWLVQVRDVLETLNQGVIITDECPRIVYANGVFQDMIGRSADELVGQYVKDLFPPEDVPWLLSRIGLGRIQGQDQGIACRSSSLRGNSKTRMGASLRS
jgi:PAS domain S-box-containing protein